jgi:hypothetical protein
MVLGLVTAWYFYIRSPETPKQLAEAHQALYQFLLNKWYFDELYDFIFVRPAKWLGRFLWKQGDGASSTVRPRRHCRARPGRHRPGRPAADRIPLPLRLRDADRNCSACHLDDARGAF